MKTIRLLPLVLILAAGCSSVKPSGPAAAAGYPEDTRLTQAGPYRVHYGRKGEQDLLLVEKSGQLITLKQGNKVSVYLDGRALLEYVYSEENRAVAAFMVHIRDKDWNVAFTLMDENADGVFDQKIDYGTEAVYTWTNNAWSILKKMP